LLRAYDPAHRFLGLIEVQNDGLALARRLMNTAQTEPMADTQI
jgi:hypothetical protein